MRFTLTNSAVLLFSAALFCGQVSTADARGPAGGGVQTLATPSLGGGRSGATPSFGGSRGGSSGFSFGGGGISFGGGGGRVTIGTGIGGISLGTGGHRTPTPNFNPDRRGSRGGIHIVPEVHIAPPRRTIPVPVPSYQPQPHFVEPAAPQVQPNELPTNPAPQPIATEPDTNPAGLVARQITPAEVERAQEYFQQQLVDLSKVLEQRIPNTEYDHEQVTAAMIQHKVPVKVQILVMDALKQGDYDQARDIWVTVIPRVKIPFKPSRIRVLFLKFYLMIQRGHIEYPVVQELYRTLPPEALRPSTCCGADDLLAQIEETVRINQAIGGNYTETPTDYHKPDYSKPESFSKPQKPQSNDKPYTYTDARTGQSFGKPETFGKPGGFGSAQPYGQPGQPVAIPGGLVNIVYHPKLPDRQVVVVNAQTVMVGTDGRGAFRMEQGYVAEALGHRMGHGTALADNQSDLIRSGVVILNSTHAAVSFVFGRNQVTLQPGYQQTFPSEDVISFDRGDGKKTARYTLGPGTYEFEIGEEGWNIHSKKYEVVVSNEGNFEPFHYIVQGERASLDPEASNSHTSDYPILIRFDRGDGSATKQIRWEKKHGVLQVAINPTDNLWDLFDGEQMQAEEPAPQPTPDFVPAF